MAEALVFVVLQKIAAIIGEEVVKTGISKCFEEVSEIREVRYNIKQIQREFELMQGFLRKVNVQASSDQDFQIWSEQVRQVAHEVEDIIDEYAYLVGQKRSLNSIAKRTIYMVKKVKTWHEMATQLKQVKGNLDHLTQMKVRYGITIPEGSRSNSTNASVLDYTNLIDENEIVGHFDNLPTYIKNCLLYCCLFPKDFLIPRKWIIRLMIAEGFIENRGPQITLEEVAEGYLVELAQCSLLQIVEQNVNGRAKRYRMPDLVRDVCIAKAKLENFGIGYDNQLFPLDGKAHRIIIENMSEGLMPIVESSKLRTLLLLQPKLSLSGIEGALANLRLLRVLCLGRSNIQNLPDAVFDLFNLHYLDLSRTKVKVIPKSLGNLKLLQTLDLWLTPVEKLPREIAKLSKLRHLFARSGHDNQAQQYDCFFGVPVSSNICNSKDLQTLQWIETNDKLVSKLESLLMLRTLCLLKVEARHIADLWASITKIPSLISLGIVASDEDEVLDFHTLDPFPGLEKLYLKGKLKGGDIPSIFRDFTKMRDLKLGWSGLREDPLSSFSHMSNLAQLELDRAYEGKTLNFRSGWFPKLQKLSLINLSELDQIDIEDGTMGSLQFLELEGLRKLERVPKGIRYLRTLKTLIHPNMPDQSIRNLEGDDEVDISHSTFG